MTESTISGLKVYGKSDLRRTKERKIEKST